MNIFNAMLAMIKQALMAETDLSRRAAARFRRYQQWAKQAPGKPAGSNADANRRPRTF